MKKNELKMIMNYSIVIKLQVINKSDSWNGFFLKEYTRDKEKHRHSRTYECSEPLGVPHLPVLQDANLKSFLCDMK